MKKRAAAVLATVSLLVSGAGAMAAVPKKKVVTLWKQARGPAVTVDRWGELQVVLVIRKRITTIGTRRTVARRITAVRLPVWFRHKPLAGALRRWRVG